MKSAKITYFGCVNQRSGEDWENVQLTLSTAQPSCGTLPRLGTTFVQFHQPTPPAKRRAARAAARDAEMAKMLRPCGLGDIKPKGDDDSDEEMGFGLFDENEEAVAARMPKLGMAQTKATEQALSTTFAICQPKSIPDDETEHKVTISMLEFACLPHFDCVPSKNTNVFMTGSMVNTSAYPLLSGQASIYLNNCFNQKVYIDSVSTGAKFEVPLGVVSALKVNYKPANKFHHKTGMLTKSSNVMHEQKILAKNNRQIPALLTIFEAIPKPTDEKIKVRILSPEITSSTQNSSKTAGGTISRNMSISTANSGIITADSAQLLKAPLPGARLNADNNLEWTVQLEGGREVELAVKWELEHPPNETVEFNEKWEK